MAKEFISKADISDILIERPVSFSVKARQFQLFHPTLGKIHLMSRLFDTIGFSKFKPTDDIYYFSYVAAQSKRDECLRLIAYSTLQGAECLNEVKVAKQISYLKELDTEGIATILVTILSFEKADSIMKEFGIDKENKRMSDVFKSKDKKGALIFGGKSIWGSLIDTACERYGWSYQYVLWGISYANLRLLTADQVRTVYLSEDERKESRVSDDNIVIRADDKTALNNFIKTHNWR